MSKINILKFTIPQLQKIINHIETIHNMKCVITWRIEKDTYIKLISQVIEDQKVKKTVQDFISKILHNEYNKN